LTHTVDSATTEWDMRKTIRLS